MVTQVGQSDRQVLCAWEDFPIHASGRISLLLPLRAPAHLDGVAAPGHLHLHNLPAQLSAAARNLHVMAGHGRGVAARQYHINKLPAADGAWLVAAVGQCTSVAGKSRQCTKCGREYVRGGGQKCL